MAFDGGRHVDPEPPIGNHPSARQVAGQHGQADGGAFVDLGGDRGARVLGARCAGHPEHLGRSQIARHLATRHAPQEAHAVVEAGVEAGRGLGLEGGRREDAAEQQQGVVAPETLHDVEHEGNAAVARQGADVDEPQAPIARKLGERRGALKVRQARVVGGDEAQPGSRAEIGEDVVGDGDDAVGKAHQGALPQAAGRRHQRPCARREVLLGHDLLAQVLVHIVDEARHERSQQREQGQQLRVVDVDHERSHDTQRRDDRGHTEHAPRARPRAAAPRAGHRTRRGPGSLRGRGRSRRSRRRPACGTRVRKCADRRGGGPRRGGRP